MNSETHESSSGWKETVGSLTAFPTKFILASTLIFVNIFQNLAQERKVKEVIMGAKENPKANQEAKEELFGYLS
jgi:hypothetical protein